MLNFAHFSLVVADIDTSVKFYIENLGFIAVQFSENQRLMQCILEKDGLHLELLHFKDPGLGSTPGRFDHLALESLDLDAWVAAHHSSGLLPEIPEYLYSPQGRRLLFIQGPDGERLEIMEGSISPIHPLELMLDDRIKVFVQSWHDLYHKTSPRRIHDLRVAQRRLNVILGYCLYLLPNSQVQKARRRMGKIFTRFGQLRDTQVELQYLNEDLKDLDQDWLRHMLDKEIRLLEPSIEREILAFDFKGYHTVLQHYQTSIHHLLKEKSKAKLVKKMCSRHYQAYQFKMLDARNHMDRQDNASIHRFRIAVKKMRYSVEALHQYLELDPADIDLWRRIQDQAGYVQDMVSLAAKISTYKDVSNDQRQTALKYLDQRRDMLIGDLFRSLEVEELQHLWNTTPQNDKERENQ